MATPATVAAPAQWPPQQQWPPTQPGWPGQQQPWPSPPPAWPSPGWPPASARPGPYPPAWPGYQGGQPWWSTVVKPAGPAAEAGTRIGARAIDTLIEVVLAIGVFVVVPGRRWPAALFLTAALIAIWETIWTTTSGGSPGKLAVGLRVTQLDRQGHPTPRAAFARSLGVAICVTLVFVGWVIGLVSTLMSPLRRGFHDRLGQTMVVRRDAQVPISTVSLPGYADAEVTPRMTPWGRAGTLEDRRRARARRLADAPILVLAMIVLAGAAGLPVTKLSIIISTSIMWLVVFVIDETWRIARLGATAGHRQAGPRRARHADG